MKTHTFTYNELSASQLNKLYLLNSLGNEDYNTSKISHQQLSTIHEIEKNALHIEEMTSKEHLFQKLRDIEKSCIAGVRPIIQFDMHGNTKGIEIVNTRELVSWGELLPLLTKIHLASEGNLTVVFAACEAAAITDSIRVTAPSPFFGMIAPKYKILETDLAKDLIEFYKTLFTEHRFVKATDLPKDRYYVYREDYFILENFVYLFLQSKSIGNSRIREKIGIQLSSLPKTNALNKNKLTETLLTDIVNAFPNPDLKKARNIIKPLVNAMPEMVIACAVNFVGNKGLKNELAKAIARYFKEVLN